MASTLAAGQNAWLTELATDTCRITRTARVGEAGYVAQTINATTGQYPTQARIPVYEGPCRVQVKVDINSNVIETTAGDREWTYLTASLQLPVQIPTGHLNYVSGDPADVDVDNVCEILSAPLDLAMEGAFFNVAGPFHKSQSVYRRFRVREVAA